MEDPLERYKGQFTPVTGVFKSFKAEKEGKPSYIFDSLRYADRGILVYAAYQTISIFCAGLTGLGGLVGLAEGSRELGQLLSKLIN